MLYWFLWGLGHVIIRILYRISYSGAENVPRDGPVLLCPNHLSWWDAVFLGISCRRRLYFMAKDELFRGWNLPLGIILWLIGTYGVRRGLPDRSALTRTLELLKKGKAVAIFPEGTRVRSRRFRRAEPGAGLVVLKAGVPVIPVYIQGPYGFRKPVSLTIGRPKRFALEDASAATGAQRRQAIADAIMLEIAAIGDRTADYPQGDEDMIGLPRVVILDTATSEGYNSAAPRGAR